MDDDTISRQAAIEHLKKRLYETALNNNTEHPYYEEMADNRVSVWLEEVPSAQLERKKGRWIRKSPTAWSWTCSCCKKDDAYAYSAGESFEPDVLQDLFCPNCGAYMRGEENE